MLVPAILCAALAASQSLALPGIMGSHAYDVAWETPRTLLIATDAGVFRFATDTLAPVRVLSVAELPDGLPAPQSIASDGATLVAASIRSFGSFSLRLRDGKRLIAQRSLQFLATGVAVRGKRACVVGMRLGANDVSNAAAFCGAPDDAWADYKPLHRLRKPESVRAIFGAASWGVTGAIAAGASGSMYVITAAEPGVHHYAADGALVEVLGRSLDDFVIDARPDVVARFANDIHNRYRLLLNAQSIVDDLVVTPRGPALVVRIAEKDRVRWQLLWPRREGVSAVPLRLGIDRIGPFGHLRCAANGASLACVGSMPPRRDAASIETAQRWPHLWIFDLPR